VPPRPPRDRHPFPTRRSSDLAAVARGAASVHVAATHGLFSPAAAEALMIDEIETIVVTDTVPDVEARCPALLSKLAVLETAPLLDRKSTRLNSSHVKISYAVF